MLSKPRQNAKPYLFQQLRALDTEKIHNILSKYDVNKNAHVKRIHNPKRGQAKGGQAF